ncbi:hypothetical protein COCMIDRAFT_100096 [Bipolaris oryzae ATCC 44560]|uniref:Uncharacterized protein n=1 Tax=Bipolaris oryzae ATCC 44560 TaxID=930090 RepID=W6Z848_COCMI|nr:uncharacterized protein COCMIDRAFT_100096 [Bipolaris oryzae ATCC 44560]EUC43729.1 hypothetical protein COCMIDRAFT_100096 [Bipolaris oryzae ATCC 44560]
MPWGGWSMLVYSSVVQLGGSTCTSHFRFALNELSSSQCLERMSHTTWRYGPCPQIVDERRIFLPTLGSNTRLHHSHCWINLPAIFPCSPAPLGGRQKCRSASFPKEGTAVPSTGPRLVLMSSALHALPRQRARHAPSVAQEMGKRATRGAVFLTGRARHARLCRV